MELHRIVTADGLTFWLNPQSRARWLLSQTPTGWGLPPINYLRERVYKSDGEIEVGVFLETRRFSIEVGGAQCSRDEMWASRMELLNILRPNRNGQLTYVFRQENGTEYAITARAVSDPFTASSPTEWYEWGYRGGIDFEAVNPLWFAPDETVVAGQAGGATELVFPITFDDDGIVFGDADLIASAVVAYEGTWREYPIIEVDGPASVIRLTHLQKGVRIVWMGTLASGDTLTFNLRNGYGTNGEFVGWYVQNSAGTNVANYLDTSTNLLDFALYPGSELGNDGTNTIQLSALGTDSNTTLRVVYNTQYIGI